MKKRKILGGGYFRKLRYPTILILIIGASFLMLHNSNKEPILKEEIQENTLAIYLENEQINYIPEKDSGYTLDLTKSSCTNGVTIGFDYNTWSVKTNYSNYTNTDNTRVKCSLYFKKRTFAESLVDCGALSKDAGTCIKENYHLTEEVVDDKTVDNNLRFIGANPENYVWFNDELWRIIGVMNNIDDGTGKIETRLKIIRDEAIGEYSWDNKSSGIGSSVSEYGSNDWSDAALQIMLNEGAYYNRTNGDCPYGQNGATTKCDFSTTGLTEEAKSKIDDAIWNLGGMSSSLNTATTFYREERSFNVYDGRPTTWLGEIGLLYPSDYGFATKGGEEVNRDSCLFYNLYDWTQTSLKDCYKNNWIYANETYKWTISNYLNNSYGVFSVYGTGSVDTHKTNEDDKVYPTVYLISSIKITSGAGTKENPYKLSGILDNIR